MASSISSRALTSSSAASAKPPGRRARGRSWAAMGAPRRRGGRPRRGATRVLPMGFEPMTSWSTTRRSNQLSYGSARGRSCQQGGLPRNTVGRRRAPARVARMAGPGGRPRAGCPDGACGAVPVPEVCDEMTRERRGGPASRGPLRPVAHAHRRGGRGRAGRLRGRGQERRRRVRLHALRRRLLLQRPGPGPERGGRVPDPLHRRRPGRRPPAPHRRRRHPCGVVAGQGPGAGPALHDGAGRHGCGGGDRPAGAGGGRAARPGCWPPAWPRSTPTSGSTTAW